MAPDIQHLRDPRHSYIDMDSGIRQRLSQQLVHRQPYNFLEHEPGPVLHHIIGLGEQGLDPEQWISTLPCGSVEIDNIGTFSKTEIEYYYKKFLFLKEHGYLGSVDHGQCFTPELKSDTVVQTLANVKQVVFEVTDACNLRCEYCGYGKYYCDYDERKGIRLEIGVAKRLLNYLQQLWNSNLNLSVGERPRGNNPEVSHRQSL